MPYITLGYIDLSIDEDNGNKINMSVDYTSYGNTKDTLDVDIIVK